jgi:hypothetical protein
MSNLDKQLLLPSVLLFLAAVIFRRDAHMARYRWNKIRPTICDCSERTELVPVV